MTAAGARAPRPRPRSSPSTSTIAAAWSTPPTPTTANGRPNPSVSGATGSAGPAGCAPGNPTGHAEKIVGDCLAGRRDRAEVPNDKTQLPPHPQQPDPTAATERRTLFLMQHGGGPHTTPTSAN